MGQDTGKRGIASVGGYLPLLSFLALVGVIRDTAQRRDGMKMR